MDNVICPHNEIENNRDTIRQQSDETNVSKKSRSDKGLSAHHFQFQLSTINS